ncbi:MAG: 2-hydroxyacyl-CoA dehydratase [Bacillota bacterium]
MVITFPHLGNAYIAIKALLDGLGIRYVIPPLCNKESVRIGALYSPEEICLPFKINMGNYIHSIKQGADTVLITGSCGPCRFGEYCELQAEILRKLGHDVDFIVIDKPSDIGFHELLNRIGRIAEGSAKTSLTKLRSLADAVKIMKRMDKLEAKAHALAGYEKNSGECKRLLNACRAAAEKCGSPKETLELLHTYDEKLDAVEIDETKDPVRIAIIGEIYTVIEPFANLYIEEKLMDYGVSTKRRLTPSWWVDNLVPALFKMFPTKMDKAAGGYLPMDIGGHARECIGETVLAQREGFDGAIQIFPMGCMPEIVSKSILPAISREKDFPVMSLVVDEMTGEAGYVTRIEAFIDLLERRRKNVLSGC